jgi:hypothetical protein
MKKHTIAYWMRFYRCTIDIWNVHTNKIGRAGLFVSCIAPDKSEHEFYF